MPDSLMNAIEKVNRFINGIVWGWPVIILILTAGVLLSVRTGFLQLRHFRESLRSTIIPAVKGLGKGKNRTDGVSPFEAFSAAISGTVGTGNIIGVVSAILLGGPGAVFWMWISAFFGMVTNYSENVLGLYYRKKDRNGEFSGGPFCSIAYGLKRRRLANASAVFCMLAAIGMSGVQSNKISGTLAGTAVRLTGIEDSTVLRIIIGTTVAAITAVIMIGGIKRIGKAASLLVPVMSLIFIGMSLAAIIMHIENIPRAFALIFGRAFCFKAAGSGVLGYTFSSVIRQGMARGVFSNEAGLGSSAIAYSAADTREPVRQGMWGVFGVFFDTFIICTLSALTFLTTVDIGSLTGKEEDSAMAVKIFSENFGSFGITVFGMILPLFAFTTILAWSYYGERASGFLFGRYGEKARTAASAAFRCAYVLFIAFSPAVKGDLIWAAADTFNGLMAVPNLICLVSLSGTVSLITKNYFKRQKGSSKEPMLSAYPDLNEEFKNDITHNASR